MPDYVLCAVRVLDIWIASEEGIALRLKSPDAQGIREALKYFQVSRNFKGIGDLENPIAAKVAKLVAKFKASRRIKTASKDVSRLAKILSAHTVGGALATSAASKLLWLRYQDPYVILDRRAKAGLEELCGLRFGRNYEAYQLAWRLAYRSDHRVAICSACAVLALHLDVTRARINPKKYAPLLEKRWFQHRVFDQYLWQLGRELANDGTTDQSE